ncbi:MAG: hypothetical protein ACPG52_04915 [Cognaticolwellia sp.]
MATKNVIHGESHAKAILKGMFRKLRNHYTETSTKLLNSLEAKTPTTKNIYKTFCKIEDKGLNESFIHLDKVKSLIEEVSVYYSLGWVSIDDEGVSYLKGERLYPVIVNILNSKDPLGVNNDIRGCNIVPLLYFTEHALARMIIRKDIINVSGLVQVIKSNILPMLKLNISDELPNDDFVIVTNDAYAPCCYDENGIPIVKTWIPSSSWDPIMQDKLSHVSEYLKENNDVLFVRTIEFNKSPYIPVPL